MLNKAVHESVYTSGKLGVGGCWHGVGISQLHAHVTFVSVAVGLQLGCAEFLPPQPLGLPFDPGKHQNKCCGVMWCVSRRLCRQATGIKTALLRCMELSVCLRTLVQGTPVRLAAGGILAWLTLTAAEKCRDHPSVFVASYIVLTVCQRSSLIEEGGQHSLPACS